MGVTYPPGAPSFNGEIAQYNRFLKDTPVVARALRTIESEQLMADKIFTGQSYTPSGSIAYEQDSPMYADRQPRAIGPGDEYPLTSFGNGVVQSATVVNWGQDAEITDASLSRRRSNAITDALLLLVNSSVAKVDGIAMSAMVSAVTQATGAIASWRGTNGAPNILRDVMLAQTALGKLKKGFRADAVFVDMDTFAYVASDEKLQLLLSRELPGVNNAPVQQGLDSPFMKRVGGLTWMTSPNAPITNSATLIDTRVFGEMVDELMPETGYVRATDAGGRPVSMTQVKTIREELTDRWRVRARRITVPVVLRPDAAWRITGVAA